MSDTEAVRALAVTGELPVELLASALRNAICGPANRDRPEVVWSDRGSQLILHVGQLQVRAADNALVIAVDTESVEFGVAPLIVRFVFGDKDDPAALVAATDAAALGHPVIASRWGGLFRDVVWAAIVRLSVIHAAQRDQAPNAIVVGSDRLVFVATPPVSVRDLAVEHVRRLRNGGPP